MIEDRPSNKVVLCIDDNATILSYERALLEGSGYSVITTESVQHGLELVTTCKFDVVLLDYEMPEMNGCDVAVAMRCMKPELKIILLSGANVPAHALAMVDAFVPKLETSRALLPMIADLCGRTKVRHNSHVVNGRAQQDC